MYKKCKVILLPTKEKVLLRLDDGKLCLSVDKLCQNTINYSYQHLYILSEEEEIKKGDFCVDLMSKEVFQAGGYNNWAKEIKKGTNIPKYTKTMKKRVRRERSQQTLCL